MPALSPTMTQGNIGAWKKSVGDAIQPGDVLVDIETDKAQMEFECQEEGYLAKILMPEGTKEASVGKPLAVIVDKKGDVEKFQSFTLEEKPGDNDKQVESLKEKPSINQSETAKHSGSTDASMLKTEDQSFASPLARNMAKSMGVELKNITGSGPKGRIVKADVLSASSSVPLTVSGTSTAVYTDIPLTTMRKVIAQRLCDSKQSIPHYYLSIDIIMDSIILIREKLNVHGKGKFKLSINDFVIKAAARAMNDIPTVNSTWHGSFIRQYERADISIAVATDVGLITPIIVDANLKGLVAISDEMKELMDKARTNKLRPEQFQGGTFTISNLGMFGIKNFTAIINPPQTCILAVGSSEKRLVPNDCDELVVKSMMTVTMSCDHRAVDGAVGAQWLQQFKKYMEDPITILL